MDFTRRNFSAYLGASTLVGCTDAYQPESDGRLNNPYDVARLRARKGRPTLANASCSPAPAPGRDLIVPQFYIDPPVYSRIDPERWAARNAVVQPLQTLLRTVVMNADHWASSAPVQSGFAICAITSLDAAARAGSFLGTVDYQGGYERKWTWCGLALAHLKLIQAPEYTQEQQMRVRSWFSLGFTAMRDLYERPSSPGLSMQLNNHMTWAGLTAMALGLATDSQNAWAWGLLRLKRTLSQIDAEGFLPQELMRGSKAWDYHIFTMGPLMLGALLARANGIDIADARFHRLARRTLEGYRDLSAFERKTGNFQNTVSARPNVSWLELYAGEFGVAEALLPLQGRRPQYDFWLGGNLTLWHAQDL